MFGFRKLKKENQKLKDYIESYEKILQGYIYRSAPIESITAQIKLEGNELVEQEVINKLLIDALCRELGKPTNIQKYLHVEKEEVSYGRVYTAKIKIITK